MPTAIETFDLSEYDLILSSSAAFAHGVRTRPGQTHLSYIHSPMRYAWHQYREHIARFGPASPFVRALLAYLRSWDRRASARATAFAANSAWTAKAVQAAFGRPATVIHPPVHVENFAPAAKRDDYYLTVSRLVPYKRIDLIVEAFSQLGNRLLVVGAGPEEARIKKLAKSNVELLGYQPPSEVAQLMSRAKAFVFAAEEDFGIAAVEAQAAGCPVIAFARGGLTETVIDGKTGLFFNEQSMVSLVEAIARFEKSQHSFDPQTIRTHALTFRAENFRQRFSAFVNSHILTS
jgi:glycosyltransferase involved in cell wall biosynthesis